MKRLIILGMMIILSGCRLTGWATGVQSVHAENRPTATATPLPTFTPRPTDTPWPTFTPMPTVAPVTPGVLTGVISTTVNIRLGPGTNYPIVSKLNKGTKVSVRGRDLENRWLVLVPPPSGWVNRDYVTLNGEVDTLPVVDAPPTPVPTPTAMPTWTPAPTPTPQMYVDFRADMTVLQAGACTMLRWDVEGVRAVYLDGRGQPGHGTLKVCPASTVTYGLHVVLATGGYVDRGVTIVVYPAPTSSP